MKKITAKVLSLPPYISTSWDNVVSLQLERLSGELIIHLKSGDKVIIPNLSKETIEEIFAAHSENLEKKNSSKGPAIRLPDHTMNIGLIPWGTDATNLFSGLQGMFQHDPDQKDHPNLPPSMLQRIKQVTQAMGVTFESLGLPKEEPHCNCMYCQVARELRGGEKDTPSEKEPEEEIVSDKDLSFQDWKVKPTGSDLYEVTHALDPSEHYTVYLGSPVGCTCGQTNCEHILAALRS